jgi:hypothetical protein
MYCQTWIFVSADVHRGGYATSPVGGSNADWRQDLITAMTRAVYRNIIATVASCRYCPGACAMSSSGGRRPDARSSISACPGIMTDLCFQADRHRFFPARDHED